MGIEVSGVPQFGSACENEGCMMDRSTLRQSRQLTTFSKHVQNFSPSKLMTAGMLLSVQRATFHPRTSSASDHTMGMAACVVDYSAPCRHRRPM